MSMTLSQIQAAITQLEADHETPTNVGGVALHRDEAGTAQIQVILDVAPEPPAPPIDGEIDGSVIATEFHEILPDGAGAPGDPGDEDPTATHDTTDADDTQPF